MGRQGCTEQLNFDDIGLLYVCKTVLALWLGGARNPSEGQESQAQSLDQKYPLDKGMHGNSLQDSCLKNPMDRPAWWAIVHRLSKTKSLFFFPLQTRSFQNIPYNTTQVCVRFRKAYLLGFSPLWAQELTPDHLPCSPQNILFQL